MVIWIEDECGLLLTSLRSGRRGCLFRKPNEGQDILGNQILRGCAPETGRRAAGDQPTPSMSKQGTRLRHFLIRFVRNKF